MVQKYFLKIVLTTLRLVDEFFGVLEFNRFKNQYIGFNFIIWLVKNSCLNLIHMQFQNFLI